ncbi:MAG: hypothetical protein IKF72_12180 [Kiritimatiellae bacterium]|nr:hypothetical protein [Kiritimatiellia bacterium]
MRSKAFLGLGAAALALAAACSAAEPLPKNAGFETPGAKGAGAAEWTLYGNGMWSVRRGEGRNGTSALICADVGKGGWTTQWVDVEPGRPYRVEGWVRTEDVEGSGVCIDFSWYDAYGTRLGTSATQPRVTGTAAWTKVSLEAFVPPAAAKRCLVGTPVTGNTKGRAWFDDLRIVPLELPPIGQFISDAYRNRSAVGPVTFHVGLGAARDEIAAKGLHGRFAVPSVAGGTRHVDAVPDKAAPRDVSATVDAASLPLGGNEVVFELLDGKGRSVATKSLAFTRTEKPETKGVRIDRRGIARIDGKPFFPLGMFMWKAAPDKIDHFAKGPFNCCMPYSPPTKAEMDYANAKGLKVIYDIHACYVGLQWATDRGITNDASEVEFVSRRVREFRDHPALLAWYINDELGLDWIKRLAAHRDLCERLDPDHPTWVAHYMVEDIRGHLPGFDVIGSDPYPICQTGDPPISQVMEHTRITRKGVFGARAMWQIPQAFDWGGYRVKDKDKTRPPTFEEMRNMAWQFVAEGANGLIFYSYSSWEKMKWRTPPEEMWKRVCRVGEEVKERIPIFLSDEAAPSVVLLTGDASVRAWRKGGDVWLLAVNPTYGPKVVEFALEGAARNRSVSLEPLGVWFGKIKD